MIIAIDIGGTSIKGGLYNKNGQFVDYNFEILTVKDYILGTNSILSQVIKESEKIVEKLKKKKINLEGIAISSAGVIDSQKGEVIYSGYTIPNYKGTKLKKELEKKFKVPCSVLNDVHAAALGEHWKNDIQSSKPIVYLTVGTGIGGAIIYQGKLLEGYTSSVGEVGYVTVENKTWQELASAESLVSYYKQLRRLPSATNVNGREIFLKYDENEAEAHLAVNYLVKNFVKGLVNILYIVNPEYVIIGGGIFERSDVLLDKIEKSLSKIIENNVFLPKKIFAASQGNKASTIGAIKHFNDSINLKVDFNEQ